MTPKVFIDRWRTATMKELSGYQQHFLDLCELLEVSKPGEEDRMGVDCGKGEVPWLDALHDRLDRAVARAYGWPEDIATDDALERLFRLNQARAGTA